MVDIMASSISPPLTELTPVQRSSSLRVSRLRSPEKCDALRRKFDARRQTCIPFIDSLSVDTAATVSYTHLTLPTIYSV